MSLAAVFDLIALAGFVGAIVIALLSARERMHINRLAAVLIVVAMLMMAFVSLSNFLESSGIYGGLDRFEDYVEILFFPLMGYALYVMHSGDQISRLRATMIAAQAEHALLMNIMDGSLVGIILVDDVSCVTFANRFAIDVLGITECGDAYACTSEVYVVPTGGAAPERGVFHESIQGRTIEGESWEVVGPSGRTPIGLTSTPLEESSGKMAGSVVVVSPISGMSPPPGA